MKIKSKMDTFNEKSGQQFVATTTSSSQRLSNNLKRPASLDLNFSINNQNKQSGGKKQLCNQSAIPQAILNSPDLNMLKWGTPDLEKYILSNDPMQTPTPSLLFPPNPTDTNKDITNEQEEYAKPFVDALNSLHNSEKVQQHQQQQQPAREFFTTGSTDPINTATTSTIILSRGGMSGGSEIYTNIVKIKDEPQTISNSPPISPIDMGEQKKIKLERKRQRNRVAASKCRKRKLERISKLEDKVKQLKGDNVELGGVIKSLKDHVIHLKQKVIEHINNGCSIPTYNTT